MLNPTLKVRSRLVGLAQVALACCVLTPAPVAGQNVPRRPVQSLVVGGRVNTQFNATSVDGVAASEFRIRRARLFMQATVNDWLDGVASLEYSNGQAQGLYMFMRGTLAPEFRVSFGQFKRPFDLFEFTSSSLIPVIERGGNIRGFDSCAGVGGLCSYSHMAVALQYSQLDIGVLLDGAFADSRGTYGVALTNGTGRNRVDDNDAKSVSARITWAFAPNLVFSANVSSHDYADSVRSGTRYATATALDVEWGDYESGPHLLAGIMTGENWRVDSGGSTPPMFLSWQSIVTYRFGLNPKGRIRALEPLARVNWTDPNRSSAGDSGVLLTPGLVAHFEDRHKLAINVDAWDPSLGSRAWGLSVQTYLYF